MFTLKIAHTGTAEGSASWVSGVKLVHLIDTSTRGLARSKWESYRRDHDNFVDHTSFLPDERDVALLSVVFDDGHDIYFVVGRAWLLGPDGGTIERIAP
jgi:hypothetical protein